MLTIEDARQVLQRQPFSALLGTQLTHLDGSTVTLQVEARDELRQQHGLLHGGVIAYLADNALTFAGGIALGPSVLTSDVTVEYLRPVTSGAVCATATVTAISGRTAICSARIENSGQVCAVAQGRVRYVEPR